MTASAARRRSASKLFSRRCCAISGIAVCAGPAVSPASAATLLSKGPACHPLAPSRPTGGEAFYSSARRLHRDREHHGRQHLADGGAKARLVGALGAGDGAARIAAEDG